MKNKRSIISLIIIVLLAIAAAFTGCKDKNEQNLRQKVDELNESVIADWGEIRPLTVEDSITITSGENELVKYNRLYVILADNSGYLISSAIYFGEEDHELNNNQEVYYSQNQLSIKYTDIDGEYVRQYNLPFSSFEEMISGGANDVFAYNYIYEYFENIQYQEFEDSTNITFTILDTHINDFLGEEIEDITNLVIRFKIYYNIDKIETALEYDTNYNGETAHVSAQCIAEQIGDINIPEWVE